MRFRTIGVCVCLFRLALAVSPAAAATCSNASLKGVFGYVHGRPGANSAAVTVGQLTLNGQGKITSGSWTESLNGSISAGTTTGKYSIAKTCTGTLTLNGESDATDHYNIYVNAGGKMFQMIENDPDSNQPGFGLAQGTVTCGLSGKKLVLTTNLVGLTNGNVTDTVGQVTLDGKGNISGTETFTLSGAVSKHAVTGTYSENSSCTGTWQVTPKSGTLTNFNTVVVNSGKELLLIQTDSGTVTAGNAQQ
jgi:hypothetical protein